MPLVFRQLACLLRNTMYAIPLQFCFRHYEELIASTAWSFATVALANPGQLDCRQPWVSGYEVQFGKLQLLSCFDSQQISKVMVSFEVYITTLWLGSLDNITFRLYTN